jgi:hypothetical protein
MLYQQWIAILLLCSACISIAVCEDLKAGKATVDLGDGYKASFVLPDIGESYVVEDAYAEGITSMDWYKPYGFTISSGDMYLARVLMHVYSSPQFLYVPDASIEDAVDTDVMGPRVTTPKTISGAPGFVGYDLQIGAVGTDTSNAMTGFFRCYPGSWQESGDLKGTIEVSGETGDFPASAESLEVFKSIVDSIKISGPSI